MDEERINRLQEFQSNIQCRFNNPAILNQSLTHKSYANEAKDRNLLIEDNERMEFLGDAILCYVMTDFIMEKFPEYTEGMLSKLRAHLVSENILASIAIKSNVGNYLLLGKGEESSGGRSKKSILADCMEALFAGIYLDQGLESVRNFIIQNFLPYIEEATQRNFIPDFKTILQEYAQGKLNCTPIYRVTNQNGLDHEKIFEVRLTIDQTTYGTGEGRSKKEAEQKAAYHALKKINIDGLDF
jgi:ribonuclease-3